MNKACKFVTKLCLMHLALWTVFLAEARMYSTSFSTTESPISEGGNWLNGKTDGIDWADVAVTNNMAIGLQSGIAGFDDSTAVVSGAWGSNQTVTATVRIPGSPPSSQYFPELEIRLRTSISSNSLTGYEIIFSVTGGYAQVVRWNGEIGDFTYVAEASGIALNNGDVITGTAVGNVITGFVNGVQVVQGTNDTFTTGNPGIGMFFSGVTGLNNTFGFSSFTATDGINPPAAPTLSIIKTNNNGPFTLLLNGTSNTTYSLQYTEAVNPVNWLPLGNCAANGSGFGQFLDTPTNGSTKRFYRAVWP